MDALFVIAAELLIVPLILWLLIVLDLAVGVVTTTVALVLGRRSFGEAIRGRGRVLIRRLLVSVALFFAGLLLVDLLFFNTLVGIVLDEVGDDERFSVDIDSASGSFIRGRIELHGFALEGVQGELDDPSARYQLSADRLSLDIDTAGLLALRLTIEEIELAGVDGQLERLRPRKQPMKRLELERDFALERLRVDDLRLELRDRVIDRAFELELEALELGPLRSEYALFDALVRTEARGSLAGHRFTLERGETDGTLHSTLELRDLPLAPASPAIEDRTGLRIGGSADLRVTNRYDLNADEAAIDLLGRVALRSFELNGVGELSFAARVLLELADSTLGQQPRDIPLEFELHIPERELSGRRSLTSSGLPERMALSLIAALRDALAELEATPPPPASLEPSVGEQARGSPERP